jgi:transporter family protein
MGANGLQRHGGISRFFWPRGRISWLAYFRALQMAPASRVAPIDKLSLAFTIVLAGVVLGEAIPWKVGLGAMLMLAGALLTLGG